MLGHNRLESDKFGSSKGKRRARETLQRSIAMDEFVFGPWTETNDLVMVLKGYFDDSGDDKQERFSVVGGLVGRPPQWSLFEKQWSLATYELKEPFHATDCEAQRGCCKGWSILKSAHIDEASHGRYQNSRSRTLWLHCSNFRLSCCISEQPQGRPILSGSEANDNQYGLPL